MDELKGVLAEWVSWLGRAESWWQFGVLVLAAVGAYLVHRTVERQLTARSADTTGLRRLALGGGQRIIWPISVFLVALVGRAVLRGSSHATPLLDLAVPLFLSLAVIRALVYILRKGFSPSAALKAWENLIATSIWIAVALHLLGWLPAVLTGLDALALQFGDLRISLLSVLELLLLIGLAFTLALWLSAFIERRLRTSRHISATMKVGLAKFSKFGLVTLAMILALDAVGIDLTTFAVFGGALGVGLGFGLQRIASNFISGFILILDRSIKPGDVITVGDKFGWVEELRARYIVVRNREGVETLIPNENLITSEVINWSYSDRNVRLRIPVQISYDDDPEQAMALMLTAASASDRVNKEPIPVVRLMEFGDSGINLELRVWIDDPEEGTANVRSAINLAIWRAFKEAGITIPYPQRDLHLRTLPADWPRTTS